MLRQVDQRHRQVTRAVQDADGQGGDQHQIADRRLAVRHSSMPQPTMPVISAA